MGLWLTFMLGIFIILGSFIVFYSENNEKFVEFSIALATSVIFMLIVIDLVPELLEIVPFVGVFKVFSIVSGIAFGFVLLLVLDKFIPDHHDDVTTHEDDHKNLEHIGLISSIALVIHNVVEGMAIYMLSTSDMRAAFIASVGVGLHNIPLGIVITSAFYQQNADKRKTFRMIAIVSLSTFVGGLLLFLFPLYNYMVIMETISLSVTIGMLLFILLMELIPKLRKTEHKKISLIGVALGVVLLLATLFF